MLSYSANPTAAGHYDCEAHRSQYCLLRDHWFGVRYCIAWLKAIVTSSKYLERFVGVLGIRSCNERPTGSILRANIFWEALSGGVTTLKNVFFTRLAFAHVEITDKTGLIHLSRRIASCKLFFPNV